jgi:tetratricopeptide (TPR) repeat protein
LIIALVYIAIRLVVLKGVANAITLLSVESFALSLPTVLVTYGKLIVWPTNLCPFYDKPPVLTPDWGDFFGPLLLVLIAGSVIVLLARHAWNTAKKPGDSREEARVALLAGAWFVLFLLPSLYLPALQDGAFVQDRYLYVPSAGLAILVALGIGQLGSTKHNVLGIPLAQVAVVLALAGWMAFQAQRQTEIWKDNVTLFSRAMMLNPENLTIQHNLAAFLVDAGRYDDAITLLQKLLRIDPDNYPDNNNLGQAYLDEGDREHAVNYLAKACQLQPTPAKLFQLGAVRFNLGRIGDAASAFQMAITMDGNAPQYHYALGLTLERLGQAKGAIEAFKEEQVINPRDVKTQEELARLQMQKR